MENQPSYILMLSLKEMALRRIAVALISKPDFFYTTVKEPITKRLYNHPGRWLCTGEFADKMSKLELPQSLAKQMIPILNAVGTEILKWNMCHKQLLCNHEENYDLHVVESLCWTSAGTVDDRKTAETIVRFEVLDIVKRFELACLYCLEDYIPGLWEELPEENKRTICSEGDISRVETPHLQLFLPYILKKQYGRLHIPATAFPNSFERSALCGLKTLTEYCFGKLSKEERETYLVRTATLLLIMQNGDSCLYKFEPMQEKLSDVLCYLLSLMTPEERMRIFKELPCEVLRCFLDWPWHEFFLDTADVIWTFLPESKYGDLLNKITDHIYYSNFYFPNFFQEIFLRSPRNFRKSLVDKACHSFSFLWTFFLFGEDSKTIEVIFRNIDAADRVRLVFSESVLKLVNDLLTSDSWCMVETCIREATLSKEERGRLKGAFMEFARRTDGEVKFNMRTQERKRLLDFLDEIVASPTGKRSPEDETLVKVKKQCSGDQNDSLPGN